MATGQYHRRKSETFLVNRQASQVIVVQPCLVSLLAVKITLLGTVNVSRRGGKVNRRGSTSSFV